MANDILINQVPEILQDTQEINRELVGTLAAVTTDMTLAQGAIAMNGNPGTKIQTHEVGKVTSSALEAEQEITPAGANVVKSKEYELEVASKVDFTWQGMTQVALSQGLGLELALRKQIYQAQRQIVNEMEAYATDKFMKQAYLAVTKAGSELFDPNNSGEDATAMFKLMDDNGQQSYDRRIVLGTREARTLKLDPIIRQANTSGQTDVLRRGMLIDVDGFQFYQSAARPTHTAGTATGLTLANNQIAGDTDLELGAGDGGTIKKGDIITLGNYKYVVQDDVLAANAGAIVKIEQYEGLKESATAGDALTIDTTNNIRCLAFTPEACHFATRLPARLNGRDKAISVITVQDEKSGLAFEIAEYPGVLMSTFRVSAIYGGHAVNAHNLHLLAG